MNLKLIENWRQAHKTYWSLWVAAFWGAVGGIIMLLGAFLYQSFNWWVGALLVVASTSFAVARYLKQPGTET